MLEHTPSFCKAAKQTETEMEAERILTEAKKRAQVQTPPGLSCPVLDLSQVSDTEREILQRYSNQRIEAAFAAEKTSAPPMETRPFAEQMRIASVIPCVNVISRMLGHQSVKDESGVTPYHLMHLFLERVYLRWYDGKFYQFDHGVYRVVPDLKVLVMETLEPELSKGKTNQWLRSVVELLESYPYIRSCSALLPTEEIPFVNGIYNIRSGMIRPVSPSDFFINYINVPYPIGSVSCSVFDSFLETVANGRSEIIEAIWEMLGYLLTTDMAGKCLFVLYGTGDSGKSVLGNLIASFFNPEAVSHLDISRLGDRFSPSVLQGKLLNVCMDLPAGRIRKEAVGTIKQITGGDTIEIEGKFRDAKSLTPTCKLLFASNFPLRADFDEAFLARCHAIPFLNAIPKEKQDKHLLDRLMAERPAIAVKGLNAYVRLRNRNYQFVDLGVSAFSGWAPLAQQLENFMHDCCILSPELHTPTNELFSCFNAYCAVRDLGGVDDIIQFSRQLNHLCQGKITPKKKRGPNGNLNGYDGIAIRQNGMEALG